MTKHKATSIATTYHIRLDKDFHQLSSYEVGNILDAADDLKYRKPKNANGSRGRYFFEMLKRASHRKEAK